jgi:Zn-dependent oligopeptidase
MIQEMTVEERLSRTEANLERLAAVQDQMMDLLGFTMEGERRLATRMERTEATVQQIGDNLHALASAQAKLDRTVQEIGDKLNGLIGVVDGIIRRD